MIIMSNDDFLPLIRIDEVRLTRYNGLLIYPLVGTRTIPEIGLVRRCYSYAGGKEVKFTFKRKPQLPLIKYIFP